MAATVDIGTLIYKDPAMHSGRPCITGTGMTVMAPWLLYEQGISPAAIQEEHFPHLSMESIFAALAYVAANRQEIEGYLQEDEDAYLAWEQEERLRKERAARATA